MKVFNLTDVSTPKLVQHSYVNHTFGVGPFVVGPGEEQEVTEVQIQHVRKGLQDLVAVGALALGDQPPATYLVAKAKQSSVEAPPTTAVPRTFGRKKL